MDLFDFVKDAGEKLFGGGDKKKEIAAEKNAQETEWALRDVVASMGLKVENFGVNYSNGLATLKGTTPSQAEREKIVLLVGNTRGVAQVDDQLVVEKPEPEAVMYTVASGDNLSRIAKKHYGNANKYMAIFEANKPMLKDPDKIYPGQVLRIPPLQ